MRFIFNNLRYASLTILSLALGAAVCLVFFAIARVSLLHPLPITNADRIVSISRITDRTGESRAYGLNFGHVDLLTESSQTLEAVSPKLERENKVSTAERRDIPVILCQVGRSYFRVFQTLPDQGRLLTQRDVRENAPHALVRKDLWNQLFGDIPLSDQTIQVGESQYQVVGILPESFEPSNGKPRIWIPLFVGSGARANRSAPTVGLLRQPAGASAAEEEISSKLNPEGRVQVVKLAEQRVEDIRPALLSLLLISLGLLAMVIFNVASLAVVRMEKEKENYRIRRTLGASTADILRKIAFESLIISSLGMLLAWALAEWFLPLVRTNVPMAVPRIDAVSIGVHSLELLIGLPILFTLLLTSLGTLVALKESGKIWKLGKDRAQGMLGRKAQRIRTGLLVAEIAVALMLGHSGLLLAHSFWRLNTVDPGFDHPQSLDVVVAFPPESFRNPERQRQTLQDLTERSQNLPGLKALGLGSSAPFYPGQGRISVQPAGYTSRDGEDPTVVYNVVDVDYFEALGLRTLEGKIEDPPGRQPVTVVNRSFAEVFFKGQAAKDRQVVINDTPYRVTAVIEDFYRTDWHTDAYPELFFLLEEQAPVGILIFHGHFLIRTQQDTKATVAAFRNLLSEVEPKASILEAVSIEERISETLNAPRFWNLVMGIMAAVSIILAVVGIYGVSSSSVLSRYQELAVRSAMGATPRELSMMVGLEMGKVTALGILAGILLSLFSSRLVESLLYDLEAYDLATFAAVVLLLGAGAMVGSSLPIRRASRVQPIQLMREA